MAGVLGFYAASKGSAVVPLLTGLSSSQAQSALTAVSLTVGSVTTTTSGATSGNNGTVESQSVAAGTVLNQEDSVSIVVYSYVPAPPSFPYFTPTPSVTYYCKTTDENGVTSSEFTSTTDVSAVYCDDYRTVCQTSPGVPNPSPPPACATTWYCRYMENTGDTFTYTSSSNDSYCTNGVAGVSCSTSGYPAPSSGIYTCPPAPAAPPTFTPPTFTPPTFTPAPCNCFNASCDGNGGISLCNSSCNYTGCAF
jgi:hypothetical protein